MLSACALRTAAAAVRLGSRRCLSVSLLARAAAGEVGPWRLGRLNHVAIATTDLRRSTALYRDVLGATVSDPTPLPEHGVTTVFISLDNTKLELLEPLGHDSPIANFLQKNPAGGMHHVCLEVDDLDEAIRQVRRSGVRCLGEKPKIGAHGKPVMFLHPKDCDGVLVELEQA